MRMRYTPVLVGACLFGPGCSFVCNIERNMCREPKVALDQSLILKRHERLGAWPGTRWWPNMAANSAKITAAAS